MAISGQKIYLGGTNCKLKFFQTKAPYSFCVIYFQIIFADVEMDYDTLALLKGKYTGR